MEMIILMMNLRISLQRKETGGDHVSCIKYLITLGRLETEEDLGLVMQEEETAIWVMMLQTLMRVL